MSYNYQQSTALLERAKKVLAGGVPPNLGNTATHMLFFTPMAQVVVFLMSMVMNIWILH